MTNPTAPHRAGDDKPFGFISGLTQWLIWFVSMTGLAVTLIVLYMRTGWSDGITWVIFGLFLVTLSKSFFDILFLERQTRLASEQVHELRQLNDVGVFLDKARRSLFRSHINSLHTIFLNDPNLSQDALIEVTHARLMARNKVVELFASILITLGLIGTIVGLIHAVGGLRMVLADASGDMEGLMEGMNVTVTGLGTAFYTTLFGAIFGGVVLRILTSVVDANILRYMAHLAQLTEVNVLPAMRRIAARMEAGGYYRNLDQPS